MCTTLNPVDLAADIAQQTIVKLPQTSSKPVCGTPMSELSTAPNTPAAMFCLADPLDEQDEQFAPFGRLESPDAEWESTLENTNEQNDLVNPKDCQPRLCVGMPPLQSELGKWAQWAVEWETLNCQAKWVPLSTDDDYDNDDDEETEEGEWESTLEYGEACNEVANPDDCAPRLCVGLPALQSELGKWAQWAVNWESQNGKVARLPLQAVEDDTEGQVDSAACGEERSPTDFEVRLCAGMPALKSDLGKWAAWVVEWESLNESPTWMPMPRKDSIQEEDDEDFDDDHFETTLTTTSTNVEYADAKDCEPRLCVGMPPLQSELGKWARWRVEWERMNGSLSSESSEIDSGSEYESADSVGLQEGSDDSGWESPLEILPSEEKLDNSEYVPKHCVGMPPLQSDLGKWAAWMVNWEMHNGIAGPEPTLTSELGRYAEQMVQAE